MCSRWNRNRRAENGLQRNVNKLPINTAIVLGIHPNHLAAHCEKEKQDQAADRKRRFLQRESQPLAPPLQIQRKQQREANRNVNKHIRTSKVLQPEPIGESAQKTGRHKRTI